MLLKNPKISVVLPVYNGFLFISRAVESILTQTFKDFELIIIDDGSSDGTRDIIKSFQDERIVIIVNEKNIGLINSLNKGIGVARGEFIARMDADDISEPERFEKQIGYLEKNIEVGVLGTAVSHADAQGRKISILTQPTSHEGILWKMCFECAVIHPTVMMRRDLVLEVGGYDINFPHIEDTELWMRMIRKTKFANLPDVLLMHRLHPASIGSTQSEAQYRLSLVLREHFLKDIFGLSIPSNVNRWFSLNETKLSSFEVHEGIGVLFGMYEFFVQNQFLKEESRGFIRQDFLMRVGQLMNGDKGRIGKNIVHVLKALFPVSVRHRLKTQAGKFFR
ncbi:MAG: glycosyltransferase [Candidatus Paceibacterota bacterium]|jgi:glycosyltransferase involved in cell wall biosynthesis